MERPRALARRACASLFPVCVTILCAACSPQIEKLPKERSPRESLGQEIYKVLCRRVAGTELPKDFDGRQSETLCLGDPEAAAEELEARRDELPPRLVALAERRSSIADALDEGLPEGTGDGLEEIMRALLPFYDPPDEQIQEGTRLMAATLKELAANDQALASLERYAREGMAPAEGDFGVLRALLSYPDLSAFLRTIMPALLEDDALWAEFRALLAGLALEMATTELETDPTSNVCRTRDFFSRTETLAENESAKFSSGDPLYVPLRDVRGMPIPTRDDNRDGADLLSACGSDAGEVRDVPYPFVDADNDGLADIDGPNFVADADFSGSLPEPFPVAGEPETARDEYGRAFALQEGGEVERGRSLFLTQDADATALAATLREAAKLFAKDRDLLTPLATALPAWVGEETDTLRRYEKATYSYSAPDPDQSPLLALLHASGATTEDARYDESLELTLKLLREHEHALMTSLEPILALERRTRPADDAYPDAKLEQPNTFWDELLWEAEKMSRRRNQKGGETLLEAAARATLGTGRNFDKPDAPVEELIAPDLLALQGGALAMMLRFKDEWRANPVGASKREPGDPAVIGSLQLPVDRESSDTPITCGKDGCGGPIEGSPFERWKQPNQNCIVQIPGRPSKSKDCGAPANQSLFHRSLGMLAEMRGRAQCNKPITVKDLFDFASGKDSANDPNLDQTVREAEDALRNDYTCPPGVPDAPCRAYEAKFPAAFVARTDALGAPLPSAIQECALLDIDDVGRTFGQVLTHEYKLVVPNPWVRRYLEDVARAADDTLPTCPELSIVDPTVAPPCIPQAASLSRSVFEELTSCKPEDPDCIDTLGELVEFLLDDKDLFQSERDLIELRPDARTLSRVMFTPAGASEGFQLFDPLLLRGSPDVCVAGDKRPACDPSDPSRDDMCCIGDVEEPPVRFRLDTQYGATTYAWEYMVKLKDGREISFLDAMRPLADAFNRLDIPEGADPESYEDQEYVLTRLGGLVALHYDSPANSSAQNTDPDGPGYRKLTGLVRYEELLADLLDDGAVDLDQAAPQGGRLFAKDFSVPKERQMGLLAKSLELLLALRDMRDFHGGDGIASLARTVELMLNPHAFCAGDGGDSRVVGGIGACDAERPVRLPIAARDGRDYKCFRDGVCFDGSDAAHPLRYVSMLNLVFDALRAIDSRAKQDPAMDAASRAVLSRLLDNYAAIDAGLLEDRRLRALVLLTGDVSRERWADEKARQTLATWPKRNEDDAVDALTNPAAAAGMRLLQAFAERPEQLEAVRKLLFALFDEAEAPAMARAFLAFSADSLQRMPGDETSLALLRVFAGGLAKNLESVLAGDPGALDIEGSLTWNNVFMLGETARADTDGTIDRVMGAMTRARGPQVGAPGLVPISTLVDALLDINRVDPAAVGQHSADDYRAAFERIADVMLDKRRGFERMYALVRCARQPDDPSCD